MMVGCGVVLWLLTEIFLTPLLLFFGSPDNVLEYAKAYTKITAFGFPFLILGTGGGHLIRADGSPKFTMVCNLTGAVINTILDYLFVSCFGWGMEGAAVATIIGQIVSAAMAVYYFCHYKTVSLQKCHMKPQKQYVGRVASLGMAPCSNQLAMMVVQIVMNKTLKYYGGMSSYGESIPIACSGIIAKVNMIYMSFIIGISQGLQPIVSFNYGAGKFKRVKKAYGQAILVGGILSIAAFLVFQLFPRQIIALFGEGSEAYYTFAISYFRVFLFFTFLNVLQPISSNFFTAIGKPIKGVFLSLTRQTLFLLPLILILPIFMGIDGVLYAGPIADVTAGVVSAIMVWKEFGHSEFK
jgi:Na+-driven multidrug efflux pump